MIEPRIQQSRDGGQCVDSRDRRKSIQGEDLLKLFELGLTFIAAHVERIIRVVPKRPSTHDVCMANLSRSNWRTAAFASETLVPDDMELAGFPLWIGGHGTIGCCFHFECGLDGIAGGSLKSGIEFRPPEPILAGGRAFGLQAAGPDPAVEGGDRYAEVFAGCRGTDPRFRFGMPGFRVWMRIHRWRCACFWARSPDALFFRNAAGARVREPQKSSAVRFWEVSPTDSRP